MAPADLEIVLGRLGNDDEFRAAVNRDPLSALAPYELSRDDLRAVELAASETHQASESFQALFAAPNVEGNHE